MDARCADPRLARLEESLRALGGCLVAYSGGVDSTFLLAVARRALGDRVAAATVRTLFLERGEVDDARRRAAALGVRHEIIDLDLAAHPEVLANPPDRCYHCKRLVFTALRRRADELGLPVLVDATHADDLRERRPGRARPARARRREPAGGGRARQGRHPRALGGARDRGGRAPVEPLPGDARPLRHADHPGARCAASPAPSACCAALGFAGTRVRDYGDLARIELQPADLERAAAWPLRRGIVEPLRDLGYRYVTLDLAGYRSGSMDEALPAADRTRRRARPDATAAAGPHG